ncbi:MAG: sigma-70 family RNA polymerase sigma factor [Acidobacteriota bacterium]
MWDFRYQRGTNFLDQGTPSGGSGRSAGATADNFARLLSAILTGVPAPAGRTMLETADSSGSIERADRLAAVYRDNYPVLSALAGRRFRVPDSDVQGVIHEVFVSFLRHERKIRDTRAWLVGAVCKASRKYWSTGRREESADFTDCADPKPVLDTLMARVDALHALRKLGERCREVVRLRFFEGFDFTELASRFSITEGSAKLKLARCMQTARQLMRAVREKGRA